MTEPPGPQKSLSRASIVIAAFSTIVEWYDFTLYLYFSTVLSRVFFGGGLLGGHLLVEVELGAVHRLGGLLGLARKLAELCHRVVGWVGHHVRGADPR